MSCCTAGERSHSLDQLQPSHAAQNRDAASRPSPASVPSTRHPASSIQHPAASTHLKASAQEKTTWAWPGLRLMGNRASMSLQSGSRQGGGRAAGAMMNSRAAPHSLTVPQHNKAQGWAGSTMQGALAAAGGGVAHMRVRWYFARLSACMVRGPVWLTTSLRSCTTSSRSSAASDAACRGGVGARQMEQESGVRGQPVNGATAPGGAARRRTAACCGRVALTSAEWAWQQQAHPARRRTPRTRPTRTLAAALRHRCPACRPVHRRCRRQGPCHNSRPTCGP